MDHGIIVVGLSFGDEGKGTTVDSLCRTYPVSTVVRFNGGSQAGHNVITPDGRHHTFSQFGSGSFTAAKTFLSRFMLINPFLMIEEAQALTRLGVPDVFKRTCVSRQARILTPFQVVANRLRELSRGAHRHGSCGHGIGEVMLDEVSSHPVLRVKDLTSRKSAFRVLDWIQEQKRGLALELKEFTQYLAPGERQLFDDPDAVMRCAERYVEWQHRSGITLVDDDETFIRQQPDTVVFEGAQGILLDEKHGFHPHTTWSTTTTENAETLCKGSGAKVTRLGVMRTYLTRHGAGPLPTEWSLQDADMLRLAQVAEPHNIDGPWQAHVRFGWHDLALLDRAIAATGGLDGIAITHLDTWDNFKLYAPARERSVFSGLDSPDYLMTKNFTVPVFMTSRGPTATDKEYRQ